MADDVFISYAHKDREFVDRLAGDLHQRGALVFFDRSDLKPGDDWRQVILDNIQGCKVFVFIISPISVTRPEVLWELEQARKAEKRIIPVIYRTAKMSKELAEYVGRIQYVDLRSGSYADNFQFLLDGLVAGAALPEPPGLREFLRKPAPIHWKSVWGRMPGWGLAWGLGWFIFWLVIALILLFAGLGSESSLSGADLLAFFALVVSGGLGGVAGGLVAGFITMVVLRRNAPSVAWPHMSPAIGIWAVSGPLGTAVSVGLTVLLINIGVLVASSPDVDCSGLGFQDCLGQLFGATIQYAFNLAVLLCGFSFLFMLGTWFLTGMFAGWWAVRRIRRMEPGIDRRQSTRVSLGWGCGAVSAALMFLVFLGVLVALTS